MLCIDVDSIANPQQIPYSHPKQYERQSSMRLPRVVSLCADSLMPITGSNLKTDTYHGQ